MADGATGLATALAHDLPARPLPFWRAASRRSFPVHFCVKNAPFFSGNKGAEGKIQ